MEEARVVAEFRVEDPASTCTPLRESRRPPCPVCQAPLEPEHAHHKCPACGYIEPCCGW